MSPPWSLPLACLLCWALSAPSGILTRAFAPFNLELEPVMCKFASPTKLLIQQIYTEHLWQAPAIELCEQKWSQSHCPRGPVLAIVFSSMPRTKLCMWSVSTNYCQLKKQNKYLLTKCWNRKLEAIASVLRENLNKSSHLQVMMVVRGKTTQRKSMAREARGVEGDSSKRTRASEENQCTEARKERNLRKKRTKRKIGEE